LLIHSEDLKEAVDQMIDGKLSSCKTADVYNNDPVETVTGHIAYYNRTEKRLIIGEGRPTIKLSPLSDFHRKVQVHKTQHKL